MTEEVITGSDVASATDVLGDHKPAPLQATPEQIELAWKVIFGDEELPPLDDPEIVSRAIMERIRNSETFEEAFAEQTLKGWRDLLDVPVRVLSFHLNRSTVQGGGAYAVVDLVDGDGVQHTVTCGGRNVLAQLVKMLEQGWMDKTVKMAAKQTSEGYTALWLTAA